MGLGGISLWQLIFLIVFIASTVLVFGPVARKAGFSRWWALLLVVPLANLLVIWLFAFMAWPAEKRG